VVSITNCVAQRPEEPERKSYHEHNHADGPNDRHARDETNKEKNQSENNHNASSADTKIFISSTEAISPLQRRARAEDH
jgi:hypothetical protein